MGARTTRLTGYRIGSLLLASLFLWACGEKAERVVEPDTQALAPPAPVSMVARGDVAGTSTETTAVLPVVVDGNPTCTDLGYQFGYKPQPEPPPSGTYTFPSTSYTVAIDSDGTYFDWTSTLGIDAVIVKGGNNANSYVYEPPAEAYGGTGLSSPINPNNGTPYAISHIEFCYDFELDVEKNASTSYSEGYDQWMITKTPDADYVGFPGDSWTHTYTVAVAGVGEPVQSNWAVEGSITIENNTPFDATIASVSDVIAGVGTAAVSCPVSFPHDLVAGGELVCTYASSLPNSDTRLNTATAVVADGSVVGDGTGTASVDFTNATVTYLGVTVTDDYGSPGEANSGDDITKPDVGSYYPSGSFTYSRDFSCPTDESLYTNGVLTKTPLVNTAEINETGDTDDATVTVTCYPPADAKVEKKTVVGSEDIGQFPFTFELYNPSDVKVETQTLNAAGTVAFTTEIKTEGTWTVKEVDPSDDGWVNTDGSLECTFEVAFPGSADKTYTCTFNNTEKSRVRVYKTSNGVVNANYDWVFAIFDGPNSGEGSSFLANPLATATTAGDLDGLLTFGNPELDLDPFKAYTVCEMGNVAAAGWTSEWEFGGVTTNPYNPHQTDGQPQSLGFHCVDFGAETAFPFTPGEYLQFDINNSKPGGEARTPGYWKNWSSCTNGGQYEKAIGANDPDNDFWALDELLTSPGFLIGDLTLGDGDCEEAVNILDHRDIKQGRKRANDAAYDLARNLFAYYLNQAAGAYASAEAEAVAVLAQDFLANTLDFDGEGSYLRSRDDGYAQALEWSKVLDDYNNNLLDD